MVTFRTTGTLVVGLADADRGEAAAAGQHAEIGRRGGRVLAGAAGRLGRDARARDGAGGGILAHPARAGCAEGA